MTKQPIHTIAYSPRSAAVVLGTPRARILRLHHPQGNRIGSRGMAATAKRKTAALVFNSG
jgi:hypothetical protein